MQKITNKKDFTERQNSRVKKAVDILVSHENEEISEFITNAIEVGGKNLSFLEDGCEIDDVYIEQVIISLRDSRIVVNLKMGMGGSLIKSIQKEVPQVGMLSLKTVFSARFEDGNFVTGFGTLN